MTTKQTKPLFWRVLFLFLSLAYLVPEIIFNSQLVSLAGLGTPDDHAFRQLELFGRAISGIGASLLIADLLPGTLYNHKYKGITTILAVLIICWPMVFFGQKLIVEQFLISPSSAEQRKNAVISAAFRDALAVNAVEIVDLKYKPEDIQRSENLTFLALFGGLLYSDDMLAFKLDQHKEEIIRQLVKNQTYQDIDKHYTKYSKLYEKLSEAYKEYAQGSNEYNKAIANTPNHIQKNWQAIDQRATEGWQKYLQAKQTFANRAEKLSKQFGPKIAEYFKRKNKCFNRYKKGQRRETCIKKLDDNYKAELNKTGLGYIEPEYWLIVENPTGYDHFKSLVIIAAGGQLEFKGKEYKYTSDPEHYKPLIESHPNYKALFTKETGYPMNITDLGSFKQHGVTQEKLRTQLTKQGLILPSNWNINQYDSFSKAVSNKVKQEAQVKWQQATDSFGSDLPVNLNWQSFQLHPNIQQNIAQEMGDMYVPKTKTDWNKSNFKKHILDPNIHKQTQHYLTLIDDPEVYFEDGDKYAEAGQKALRSILIPPISMSLSLFLICVTILKLPIKLLEIFKPNWSHNFTKAISLCINLIPLLLLIITPVVLIKNSYTKHNDSPVNYFLNKTNESSNPIFSYALRWTLHVQPILHPLGLALEDKTKIYHYFEPTSTYLSKFDDFVLPPYKENRKVESPSPLSLDQVRLTIISNPDNAIIRIMNIVPKYQDQMILKPGNYDIEVSAPGYKTERKTHALLYGDHQLHINLEKQ